jgi:DNA processing protein
VALLCEGEDTYPRLLREIPDPPAILYCRGQLLAEDALAVAIVGTRHATSYGICQAERLAASLTRAGLTVVSGLARGIDQAAHRGALEAGGRTIALVAGGLLDPLAPGQRELAPRISERGALLSENPPRFRPLRGAFPRRNRLITGISLGVIVVEASFRSGALISARHAMEQGREGFAVPGRADSRTSHGCHQLLRDGAKLVETADDVLEELGPLVEATPDRDGHVTRHPAELQLNDQEQQVLHCIDTEPTAIDRIAGLSGLPIHRVLSTISVLEMRHLIVRISGQTVARR